MNDVGGGAIIVNTSGMEDTPARGFLTSEFETRTAEAQALMAASNIAALLLTTEPEVRYFSGFLTPFWLSPTRPWFVVVPSNGKPIAVIPEIGASVMTDTWIDDVRTWPSPQPDDEGVSLVADALANLSGGGLIGVPMGAETTLRMPLRDFERLKDSLPSCSFVDATHIIRSLRMTKSEAEIDKIRFVCGALSALFDELPTFVRAGMSEIEIFRVFRQRALDAGADDVPYLVGGLGAGGVEDIISPPTQRVAGLGDVLMLDTGATFDGYFCDFDRNYSFGPPSESAARAYRTTFEAMQAGLSAARPGVTCRALFEAMQGVLVEGGALGNDVGRLGHGLGMQLTEWPSHAPHDETVLKSGMVITLEPGMTFAENKVMVLEENIVVHEDGYELLTGPAEPEIPIIG